MGDTMQEKEKPPSLLMIVFAGGLLFGAWFLVLYPWIRYQFWQSDTFWLIEVGRLILEKHSLPTHDIYSFTSTASQWIVYQWLGEVIFALAHAADGLAGVALLGGVLMAILLFVLMFRRMLKCGTNAIVGVAAIALTAYAYYPDFSSLRPQLFSFVLFWLVMVLSADAKRGAPIWKLLIWTFIISIFWANCHLSFLIAMVLLGANFAGALLSYLRKRSDKKLTLLFAAMIATFTIGTLFTPYGISLWLFIANTHNLYYSQEVQPLVWTDQKLLMTFAAVTTASCFILRKKLEVSDFLFLVVAVLTGSNCARLIVYFCIFSCPIIGEAVTHLLGSRLNQGTSGRLSQALKSVAMSRFYVFWILALTTFIVLRQPTSIPRSIPIQAAKYLALHPIAGNMFCSAHAGSYLIYSSHGAIPVFMDTRIDLYDTRFCERFVIALELGEHWKELFSQYKIVAALVPNGSKLRIVLDTQSDWKQIYRDREFSIYVQNDSSVSAGQNK
jgi:hypothetical protein